MQQDKSETKSSKVTSLKQKEIKGIQKALDLLIERKNFFAQEYQKAAHAGIRFSLKKQIEDLENEIKSYRKKLEE